MVVSRRAPRFHRRLAGIEQREAAGAVGRFHHAGLEAALPNGRGLLVARNAEDFHRTAEQMRQRRAEVGRGVAHLRKQRGRNAEQLEQFRVPLAGADVEQRGARRIGGVGRVRLAAGEVPEQIRVDRAEGELAGLRRRARAGYVVEQPRDLRRREIRIEQQSGALGDELLVPAADQRGANIMCAAILPDDRVVDRLAGRRDPR